MATVIAITANPLLNLVAPVPVRPNAVNRLPDLAVAAEGKGVNVGRLLARHGHRVIATGFAGGHSGAWLRDLVCADGMEDAFIATAAPLRLGFMAPGGPGLHPTTAFANGFAVTPGECDALLTVIAGHLPQADLVVASGSVSDRAADDLYVRLLDLCAARGVACWLDSYGPAMSRALTGAHPPLLAKPNRDEFARSPDWGRVAELHLTDGGGPVEVRRADGRWRITPPPVREVNPVGCGDCYLAGLAHARLAKLAFEDGLRYAAACGAANALREDVGQIHPAEAEPLAAHAIVERLA